MQADFFSVDFLSPYFFLRPEAVCFQGKQIHQKAGQGNKQKNPIGQQSRGKIKRHVVVYCLSFLGILFYKRGALRSKHPPILPYSYLVNSLLGWVVYFVVCLLTT